MNATRTCYLSLRPCPDETAIPALASGLSAAFPLPENHAYLRALSGDAIPSPVRARCERVGALALLPDLLRHMGVDPAALILGRNAHGRPYLTACGREAPVDFNLSHSAAHVACACVASPFRVGVDVEEPIPPSRAERLIARFCTAGERRLLDGAPLPGQHLIPVGAEFRPNFLCLWTLREAMAKYIGTGGPVRYDASSPPSGVRLLGGQIPDTGGRFALCVSGDILTPLTPVETSLLPLVDFDLLIP